jgi:hypothetical protein
MSEYKEVFVNTDTGLEYEPSESVILTTPKAISLDVIKVDSVTGKVTFSVGNSPSVTTKAKVLLDKITLALLTSLGESLFNPNLGCFITSFRSQNSTDLLSLYALISTNLNTIQNNILATQSDQATSTDQRLLSLKLNDVYRDSYDPTAIYVEVLVVTENNEEYILTV